MKYFVQGNNLIFKDKTGHLKCNKIDQALTLSNTLPAFINKNHFHPAVSSISDTLKSNRTENELDTLILHSQLLSYPGLTNTLEDKIGSTTKIESGLEHAICSQGLDSGEYSLIDICENESYKYNFEIENNQYCIHNKIKLDNSKFKQVLANKFPGIQSDVLFHSLCNYSNVIEANQFLANNEITEEDFSTYTLSEISLGTILQDIYFSDFFNFLSLSIQDFSNEYNTENKLLIIKSALTGFHPLKKILTSNIIIKVINELDVLNESNATNSIKCKNLNAGFELKCYPSNKIINFPYSSWILSDTDNLSIELINENKTFLINCIELKDKLSPTFFSINNKKLVKYFIVFEMDICNNILFKITNVDKEEFYYILNTKSND